ncbi:hypothetical protein SAMN05421863_100198 [Nitrosomonas communis]|uniref:Uncharacterized protein n=1 Tax=Nitrosomonas communis TaxID=44574 RepID=A0A1I4IXZ9_9PROT|nr:hypothetical protein SAMN05421863_100198 [Nitrosomonas communis]
MKILSKYPCKKNTCEHVGITEVPKFTGDSAPQENGAMNQSIRYSPKVGEQAVP